MENTIAKLSNQKAYDRMKIKELTLCIDRCNKAMAMLELIGKVIPMEKYQSSLDAQMASYRGLRDIKLLAQASLEKYQV